MATTIRSRVDGELVKRVGSWFTVREIQDTLRINPATLKPLIMKYAREDLLKRRHVKGTARAVQFSPAAKNANDFKKLISNIMPYRPIVSAGSSRTTSSKSSSKSTSAKSAGSKTAARSSARSSAKAGSSKKSGSNVSRASSSKSSARSSKKGSRR